MRDYNTPTLIIDFPTAYSPRIPVDFLHSAPPSLDLYISFCDKITCGGLVRYG